MPDSMIVDTVVAPSSTLSLKTLLRDYRKASKKFNDDLIALGHRTMEEHEYRAAEEAAAAPTDLAREAMIAAPVATLEDIALKLQSILRSAAI